MFYKLHYFKKANSICADDLKETNQIETINLLFVSSLSDLKKFYLPFSGDFRGNYAFLTMNNGDNYFIDEKSFADVTDAIGQLAQLPLTLILNQYPKT